MMEMNRKTQKHSYVEISNSMNYGTNNIYLVSKNFDILPWILERTVSTTLEIQKIDVVSMT